MSVIKVLFVCKHNSARSQMAEEFLRELGGGRFEASSAGLEPTQVNPLVIEAMKEAGHDLSDNVTTDIFELFREGKLYQYVITVCSPEVEKLCPMFPGVTERLNWPFPDPARAQGTYEEKLEVTRQIRDDIKEKVTEFINQIG